MIAGKVMTHFRDLYIVELNSKYSHYNNNLSREITNRGAVDVIKFVIIWDALHSLVQPFLDFIDMFFLRHSLLDLVQL